MNFVYIKFNLSMAVTLKYLKKYSHLKFQSFFKNLFDSIGLIFFNIFLTAFPILFFGFTEKKVSIKKLDADPYFYRHLLKKFNLFVHLLFIKNSNFSIHRTIRKNRNLKYLEFFKWNILGRLLKIKPPSW